MAGPISPKDVGGARAAAIPEEVFQAFNELIVRKWDGSRSRVLEKEAVDLAAAKLKAAGRGDVESCRSSLYENGWLDVEASYRRAGWRVEYDKPGYCETYDASYEFSRKRR